MATASTETLTLTLTNDEAKALATLLFHVGGDDPGRSLNANVAKALSEVGVEPDSAQRFHGGGGGMLPGGIGGGHIMWGDK